MEALVGIELAAVGGAALAGYQGLRWLSGAIDTRRRSRAALYERTQPIAWLLLHGVPPLMPLAAALLRISAVASYGDTLTELARRRRLEATPEAMLSLVIAAAGVALLVTWLLSGTLLCAVAVVVAAVAVSFAACSSARDKATSALRAEIPDALRSMAVCSKAGLSLQQTLEQTASETHGQLRGLFESAARRLSTGEPPEEALSVLRGRKGLSELAFVAVALDVQHQCGGSLATVLESACDTVEGELELERTLKVQTAQAKLSARIVTLMPFLLLAVFTLLSPDFLSPFFSSVAGMVLLAVALAMQGAGVLVVRRLLKVEVD